MRRAIGALFLAIMLVSGQRAAQAQSTPSQITATVNANLPDNTSFQITPARVRSTLLAMASSWLYVTNNLSDLTSAAAARINLGLAAVASSGSASDLTAGTLPAARLPRAVVTPVITSYNVQTSDDGSLVQSASAGGALTTTLPSSPTVGFTVGFVANGQNQTVVAPAGKIALPTNVEGDGGLVASTVLNNTNGTLWLRWDGVNWIPTGGTADTMVPFHSVVNPSSDNLFCTLGHQLLWSDMNMCLTTDVMIFQSNDPSALFVAPVTGSVTTSEVDSITFTFGAGSCASGCTVSYTAVIGDTLASVSNALDAAIKANVNLYLSPNGGVGGQVLGVSPAGAEIALDFDSRTAMAVTTASSGTVVITPPAGCNVRCPYFLDNNPVLEFARKAGIAPQSGSQIFALDMESSNSAAPATVNTIYAQIIGRVIDSVAGSLVGQIEFATTTPTGGAQLPMQLEDGIFTQDTSDKGLDTINTEGYWISSGAGSAVYEIYDSGNTLLITTFATNNPVIITAGCVGIDIGCSTGGLLDVNGTISALSSGSPPAAGSGVTLFGGSAPIIIAENWATSTELNLQLDGAIVKMVPGTAASEWDVGSAALAPITDNSVTLGTASLSPSSIFAYALNLRGSASGTATIAAPAAAGTPTLTLPTGSGTIADSATAPVAVSAAGAVSITGAAGKVLAGSGPAFTATPVLGVAGSILGTLAFANTTSGSITLQPVSGALGSSVLNVPAATDTLVARSTTDTLSNKTLVAPVLGAATGTSLALSGAAGASLTISAATGDATIMSSTATNTTFVSVNNNSGTTYFGNESSAGGSLMAGDAAYAGVISVSGAFPLAFGTNATQRMSISSSGTVSMLGAVVMPGVASSSAPTTGTVCWTTITGNLTVDTTLACLSSLEELKNKHGNISDALAEVDRLEPFWYTWKPGTPEYAGDRAEQPGLGAHQVASVDRRLVAYDDKGRLRGVRYAQLTAVLVEAIKELKEDNDNLRADVERLKKRGGRR